MPLVCGEPSFHAQVSSIKHIVYVYLSVTEPWFLADLLDSRVAHVDQYLVSHCCSKLNSSCFSASLTILRSLCIHTHLPFPSLPSHPTFQVSVINCQKTQGQFDVLELLRYNHARNAGWYTVGMCTASGEMSSCKL